ncbi:MAG: LysR family transcriptional regulator [Bacteroidales bacterium]|nr:LysR family transcriptional regulator [Bacteroidales bacterium]MDD4213873.1 LysR family transcriptional regulator [Bacteroidales bacterium]
MEKKFFKRYSNIRINYKLWMSSESGKEILDDAKWQMLISIHQMGSLKAAADKENISYRKAWGDVIKMENILGFHLVEKHRGGKTGGLTILTDEGKRLVEAYVDFRAEFQNNVNETIRRFKKTLKQ